jgi:hypothetical protein
LPESLEQSVQVKERFAMRLQFVSKVPNKTRCISASARMEQITVVVQGVSQNIGASSFHTITCSKQNHCLEGRNRLHFR